MTHGLVVCSLDFHVSLITTIFVLILGYDSFLSSDLCHISFVDSQALIGSFTNPTALDGVNIAKQSMSIALEDVEG